MPDSAGYLSGDSPKGYLTDMVISQAYAKFNRMIILRKEEEVMNKINGARVIDQVSSVHNYLDFSDMIIRKGSIRSYKGERMIIPFNMKDGVAICEGKSNEDWNCSAPHGAGRIMSRAAAKKKIDFYDFQKQMSDAGIYSTSVCKNTLDEAPDAYKPMEEIVELIKDTCDIKFFMKPKINIKATDGESKFIKK
jgi:RNA-splicing ligase RtcB